MSDAEERRSVLERLEQALDYRFADRDRLEAALRHSSYAHERTRDEAGSGESACESNERLEFLGDAILALIVAEALYAAKPEWREGDLTRALHSIVEGQSLTALARSLGIGPALLLGRTEESSEGRDKPSILENTMEAVIGAMYLDGGLEVVQQFVGRVFADALAADAVPVERDSKTELQETLMASEGEFPSYRLVGDNGIEGDDVRFTVEVASKGVVLAEGVGRTKRAAEKRAARLALVRRRESEASDPCNRFEQGQGA